MRMNKNIFLLTLLSILLLSSFTGASGQDIFKEIEKKNKSIKKPGELKEGWNPRFLSSVLLTQSSYTNWSRGGENSFAWTLNTDGQLTLKRKTFQLINGLKTSFGQARVSNPGFRKTEDRIEFESLISKQFKKYLSPFVSVFVQTQFAPGYLYSLDKASKQEVRTRISNFWDPAYLYESMGFRLLPVQGLNLRLGFAAKEVMTRKYRQYSEGKWATLQSGMEFVAGLNREIFERTRIKSDMRLFSPFLNLSEVQMVWESQLFLKFNKFLSANIRTFVYYEPDISSRLQIKETMGVGISYRLFE